MVTEQELIGKTLEEARLIYDNIRPCIIDGISYSLGMSGCVGFDCDPNRLNVELKNGLIVGIACRG